MLIIKNERLIFAMSRFDYQINHDYIKDLISYAENEHTLTKEDLVILLNSEYTDDICKAADRVRKKFVGDVVHLRGLIEISNYCCRTCYYCGLRVYNKSIKRYRMTENEILQCAKATKDAGLKTVVLQGGEDKLFKIKDLCNIVEKIKDLDLSITLSIGELTTKEYADLKKAGADRYLLRIETTNRDLYKKLHPNMSFDNRVRCLMDLRELGYEVGTGCLIGLPGQTLDMLAEDILFFKNIDADMIGMGPFIPTPNTPLENEKSGNVEIVLKMLALTRLLLPDINMPATTALGVKSENGYVQGLRAGANVIMPNMGLNEYKKLYALYPGKTSNDGTKVVNDLENIKKLIISENRIIGHDKGERKKTWKNPG